MKYRSRPARALTDTQRHLSRSAALPAATEGVPLQTSDGFIKSPQFDAKPRNGFVQMLSCHGFNSTSPGRPPSGLYPRNTMVSAQLVVLLRPQGSGYSSLRPSSRRPCHRQPKHFGQGRADLSSDPHPSDPVPPPGLRGLRDALQDRAPRNDSWKGQIAQARAERLLSDQPALTSISVPFQSTPFPMERTSSSGSARNNLGRHMMAGD